MPRHVTILGLLALLGGACDPEVPDPDRDCRFACQTDQDCKGGFTCRHGRCASSPGEDCLEDFEPDAGGDSSPDGDGGFPDGDGGFPDGDQGMADGDQAAADDGLTEDAGMEDGDDPAGDDGGDLDGGECDAGDAGVCTTTRVLPERIIRGLAFFGVYVLVVHSPVGDYQSCTVSQMQRFNLDVIDLASDLGHPGYGVAVFGQVYVAKGDATLYSFNMTFPSQDGSQSTGVDNIHGITSDGANLWVANRNTGTIHMLDGDFNSAAQFSAASAAAYGLEWEADGIWIPTGDTILTKLDDTSGDTLDQKTIRGLPPGASIGDVAIGEGKIYITTGGDTIYMQPWPQP